MSRFLSVVALILAAAFTLVIGVIHARPYDTRSFHAFFRLENCVLPCWHGIHPGVTRVDEAVRILEAQPWIRDMLDMTAQGTLYGETSFVRWQSNSVEPESRIPASGLLIVEDSIVDQIFLTTTLLLGDIWLSLDTPIGGTREYLIENGNSTRFVNTILYFDGTLSVTTHTGCPMNFRQLWHTPVSLWLRTRAAPGYQDYPASLRRMVAGLVEGDRRYC